jgi:serine/threonine protein kinase
MRSNSINKYYSLIEELGSGSYGSVWKAKDKRTGGLVAIKFVERDEVMAEDQYVKFQNEVGLLTHLDHPNIQRVYGIVEEPTRYCMVMELCSGGSLMDLIDEVEFFPENMAAKVATTLIETLKYMHEEGIVHHDIKMENIMFKDKF